MQKSNVIPMPERNCDREIDNAIRALTDLIYRRWAEALDMLRKAEAEGLERLNEYTPQDRLLNLKEAAAYLGFKPRTLDEWTKPGRIPKIPFIQIGGEKKFRKSSIDAALAAQEVRPKKIKL